MFSSIHRATQPAKRTRAGEALVRRNPLYYPRARALFARLHDATLEDRRSWTRRRLARTLDAASRTPYGARIAAGATLDGWPLLGPVDVRRQPLDFVRSHRWSIHSSTGGTTGIPLPLARSARSVAVEQAALDHLLARHGIRAASARVCVLRGDDVKALDDREPPFWVSASGGRRRIFSSNHLSRDTVGNFAAALSEHRADYWWVYPTALESLIRLTREAGLRLKVPLVFSSSEVMSPWCREAARDDLGAVVLDYYGQAERVALASAGGDGCFFFVPGYAHVELVPRPESEGALYEIVGTSLWNDAMPLVRYRTGDLIRMPEALTPADAEAIALGLRPFPGVIGRDGDILVAPDGTRLTGIDHFHRGVDNIVRIQVAQTSADRVEIRVIPAPAFGARERDALISNARRKLPSTMNIEVRVVDELERTPHGKTPFVVRCGPSGPVA